MSGRVRLKVLMVNWMALALGMALGGKHLRRRVEAFLLFFSLKKKIDFVFGAGGSTSLSRNLPEPNVNLVIAG